MPPRPCLLALSRVCIPTQAQTMVLLIWMHPSVPTSTCRKCTIHKAGHWMLDRGSIWGDTSIQLPHVHPLHVLVKPHSRHCHLAQVHTYMYTRAYMFTTITASPSAAASTRSAALLSIPSPSTVSAAVPARARPPACCLSRPSAACCERV